MAHKVEAAVGGGGGCNDAQAPGDESVREKMRVSMRIQRSQIMNADGMPRLLGGRVAKVR